MSTDAAAPPHGLDRATLSARRAALRLAFGVTACFALVEALDWDATFLAPLLAANMLIKLKRAPSLAQAIGLVVLIGLSAGIVLAITTSFIRAPAVLILALALLIYLSFYAHRRGAPELATLLLQISAVSLPVLAVLSPDGAGTFAATLATAALVALLTAWAAHAAFPDPDVADAGAAPAVSTSMIEPRAAARQALLDTLVLMPMLAWFVLDASEVAVVVLIVIVTVLRQHDPGQGRRAAIGLILGNLVGGVAAAIVYNLVLVGNSLAFFIAVLLAASLIFAAFLSRLFNVLLASAYAIGGLSLLEHWRFGRSVGRIALLLATVFALGVPAVPGATAQGSSKAVAAAPALPERPDELAPFLARIDDQQARAALARVLEERMDKGRPEPSMDMLVGVEHATGRLGARLAGIAAASPEAATAPSLFWRWLTADGADPGAPWRVLAGATVILALCWAAQAVAARVLRPLIRRRTAASRGDRAEAAAMVLRWLAFLAVAAATHALVPEVNRPSRLAALAVVLAFAGTWIGSGAVAHVLPALYRRNGGTAAAGPHTGLLRLAFGIFFTGFFALGLLREAGMSADARLLIALFLWLAFGVVFLTAFPRVRRPAAANDPEAPAADLDRVERLLERHGPLFLKLSFLGILVASTLFALLRGPQAIWSGIASFGLLGILVAALGLTRASRPPSAAAEAAAAPSPWAATLRRGLRLLILLGFALALAALWDIDLFHTANSRLGERVARGIVTVAVTVVLAYLVWEVIRTALAQSALGPPRHEFERGEEGGGTAGTRLQTFGPILRNFLFVVLVTVAAMVCLSSLGVEIGPLLAGAGVIGIALGVGAQTLVRDIISGVFFLAEDAFRVGEYIEIGNTRGTVEGIAIRSLKLRHHRGPVHTVPFGEIKQLTNHSRDWVIMKLEFLLAFDTDLKKVKKIVKEIGAQLAEHPELGPALLEPVKSQGVRRMEPTGLVVGLKFMAKPGSEVYIVRREVYQRVRDAFEQNGIHFARPQVTVAAPGGAGPQAAALPDQLAAAAQALEPPREGRQ